MGRTGVIDTLRDAELLDGVKDDNGGEFWATWRGGIFVRRGNTYYRVRVGTVFSSWRDLLRAVEGYADKISRKDWVIRVSRCLKHYMDDYCALWKHERFVSDEGLFSIEKPKYRMINGEFVDYVLTDSEGSQYYIGNEWVYIATDERIYECGVGTSYTYWWEIIPSEKSIDEIREEVKLWVLGGDIIAH